MKRKYKRGSAREAKSIAYKKVESFTEREINKLISAVKKVNKRWRQIIDYHMERK
jgi:hypothetical protein